MAVLNNIYVNVQKILQEDFYLKFVTGERGVGKTYGFIEDCVNKFIESGEQFVYLRREKQEILDSLPLLLDAHLANGLFDGHVFEYRDEKIYCDKKIMCHGLNIKTQCKKKSIAYPYVTTILFDEFILEDRRGVGYLHDEVKKFLSVIETVQRMRTIRIICLANQITIYNPYYVYFHVSPSDKEFTRFKNKGILIYTFKGTQFVKEKLKTSFGKLIAGTPYGDFMLHNKNIHDDNQLVEKVTCDKVPITNMIISGNNIVVYEADHITEGYIYYFCVRKNIGEVGTINFDSLLRENTTIESIRSNKVCSKITEKIKKGRVRFNTIHCKQLIEGFIF